MKKRVLFVIFIGLISVVWLNADVLEFQRFSYGKGERGPYCDSRHRYVFKDGLLSAIETDSIHRFTGEVREQDKVTIKRYADRVEAYKNENLLLIIYYVDSTTMQLVRASSPDIKRHIILDNREITYWSFPDIWRIKIIPGEEVVFRLNNNNPKSSPKVDFIATGKDPSTVRYDNPVNDSRYEKIAENEFERVYYHHDDGWREPLARYLVIPNTDPYRIYAVDFLIDFFCEGDFVHLFWGQLIIRSQNRLSGLHE